MSKSFRVVIVGGSVAGLTLANILERYGIDYVILEKHTNITPQLGASIAIQPHAARILDQLGLFKYLIPISMGVDSAVDSGPNGERLGAGLSFCNIMEGLLGYSFRFMERQQLLEVLYGGIHDKSKVLTNCEVTQIQHLDGHVEILLKDGTIVQGDILVGADGVRSLTRSEIWRIADEETKGKYPTAKMSDSIRSSYNCVFGMSARPKDFQDGVSLKSYHKGRSYLCSAGVRSKVYWFLFVKNAEVAVHKNIPRFSKEDADSIAQSFADDSLSGELKFNDLLKTSDSKVVVPIEEFVLEKNFYKRAILIGDSFHKMNPLHGQGGGSAIESAAMLADLLKGTLDQNPKPTDEALEKIFSKFLAERKPRATALMESTRTGQRAEVLDNFALEYLALNVMPNLGLESLAPLTVCSSTSAQRLKYLPNVKSQAPVSADEDVKANPHPRNVTVTKLAITLLLFFALQNILVSLGFFAKGNADFRISELLQAYTQVIAISINSILVIEGQRAGRLFSPLISGIPFTIASSFNGWGIVFPIYLAIYTQLSGGQPFYYPSPRAVNPSNASALPPAFLVAYAPLAIIIATSLSGNFKASPSLLVWAPFISHISLPFLVKYGAKFFKSASEGLHIYQLQYVTRDMKYLSRYYGLVFFLTSTAHAALLSHWLLPHCSTFSFDVAALTSANWDRIWEPVFKTSSELVQIGSLAVMIIAWTAFTVWDMHRVNLTHLHWFLAFVLATIVSVFLGPAAVLAALWWWRETSLENGRKRLAL